MHDQLSIAALCLFLAVVLFAWVMLVSATYEPPTVRIGDKKTWKRPNSSIWGNLVGAFVFGALVAGAFLMN